MKIHIAGFPVRVGNKGRQLCGWCGHVLIDVDYENTMVASNPDGSPGKGPGFWEANDLIAVEGNGSWVLPHKDGDPLPLRACAAPSFAPRVVR